MPREGRRLAETVRMLTADRERLLARVATLEAERRRHHRLDRPCREDRAGTTPPSPAPGPSAAAATVEAAPAVPPPEDVTSSINPPLGQCLCRRSRPPPQANRIRPRSRQRHHGRGLAHRLDRSASPPRHAARRPASGGADARTARPGGAEFRLIAGPLPNAAAAARLCATMTAAGAICAPAVFDGQRLAVR